MTEKPKTEKKEPTKRVYPIQHDGKTRYIEAVSPQAAILFAFRPVIGEPLSARDVLALLRDQGIEAVEIIQTKGEPE